MPRNRNHLKTIPLKVSTTPPIELRLSELVATGFYGKNPAEAAERLIAESLRKMAMEGTLAQLKANARKK